MSFLYPSFFWASTVLTVPLIIHLFSFKTFKTVYFSDIRFLQNIKKETQSKSRIKHLLVLIARMLMLLCLVFAFAQPYTPLNQAVKNTTQEIVAVYVDNSFSMTAEGREGNLLEAAKNRARQLAAAYKPNTQFLLLTNDFEAKHQHFIAREQFIDYITALKPSPKTTNIAEVLQKNQEIFENLLSEKNEKSQKNCFLISDFQKISTNFEKMKIDTFLQLNFIPLSPQNTKNLSVDSCWFETFARKLNQPEDLFVKIVNHSNESYQNIPIKLFINDSLKSIATFDIERHTSQNVKLSYTQTHTGMIRGRIEITDYPIIYDNSFYFSYSIAEKLNVLIINENQKNPYFDALFGDEKYFALTHFSSDNIKTSEFANFQAIIVNEVRKLSSGLIQELTNYAANGGTIVFFPSLEGSKETYNQWFTVLRSPAILQIDTTKTRIEKIESQHAIYKNVFEKIDENVDLPLILKHFQFESLTKTNDETILTSLNGHKILTFLPYQQGKIYIFAMSLNEKSNNFAKHRLFVPTLYNIVLFTQTEPNIYYTIGKNQSISLNNVKLSKSEVVHIIDSKNLYDFIPAIYTEAGNTVKLSVNQYVSNADNYSVVLDKTPLKAISFNYNRKESNLENFNFTEIKENLEKLGIKNFTLLDSDVSFLSKEVNEMSSGKRHWKWFIIFSLIFLALEIGILRFWK